MRLINSNLDRLELIRQLGGFRPKGLLTRSSDLGSSRSANPIGATGSVPRPQRMSLGRNRKILSKFAGTGIVKTGWLLYAGCEDRGLGLRVSQGSPLSGCKRLGQMKQRWLDIHIPLDNKFHEGNGENAKHYWITPPEILQPLQMEFAFDFDPCPYPKPQGFDGLTCDWGQSNYVNPPFGSIVHEGKKKGPTAWVRKAIAEQAKGKRTVFVYPIDKWILVLLQAGATVRNLGDVRWLAIEDGTQGNGTGRHIAAFILEGKQ